MKTKVLIFSSLLTLTSISHAEPLLGGIVQHNVQAKSTAPVISNPGKLLMKLCGMELNHSDRGFTINPHMDCETSKPAIEKFNAELTHALGLVKEAKTEAEGYAAISASLHHLIQSKDGVKKEIKEDKCSVNDNVGEDIWARDADAVLTEIIDSKDIQNTDIKKIAQLEKMDTVKLMQPRTDSKEEEMRKAVLARRLAMYGEQLQISDNLTKQLIESFSLKMGEAAKAKIETSRKEAGVILARFLDSMSPMQKQELKHFANSFAASSVDKDFKQSVQLAMNNWSMGLVDAKPEVSTDGCFTSENPSLAQVKAGFLEGMQKVVASNREDFWSTVKQASEGDLTAKEKLQKKWGKSLPAYMESLKAMAAKGSEQEEAKALSSLNLITKALGNTTTEKPGQESVTKITVQNLSGKEPKEIDVKTKLDSSDKTKASEIAWDSNLRNAEIVKGKTPEIQTQKQEVKQTAEKKEETKQEQKDEQATGEKNDIDAQKQNPGAPDISVQAKVFADLMAKHSEAAMMIFKEEVKDFLQKPEKWEMYKSASDLSAVTDYMLKAHPYFSALNKGMLNDLTTEARAEIREILKADIKPVQATSTPKPVVVRAQLIPQQTNLSVGRNQAIQQGFGAMQANQKIIANPSPTFNAPELSQQLNNRALHNDAIKMEKERAEILAKITQMRADGATDKDVEELHQKYVQLQTQLQNNTAAQVNANAPITPVPVITQKAKQTIPVIQIQSPVIQVPVKQAPQVQQKRLPIPPLAGERGEVKGLNELLGSDKEPTL